ncbi:MAG: hypothetical protein LBM77_12690 [Spirochaetaceae bacterium]|jgi:hypothetical protein|nr:hypothetical protein [Spirochaetaceae bacterium]
MDWPNSGPIVRTFGWNDAGTPYLSIDIKDSGVIRAAETGEILFERNASTDDNKGRLPLPSRGWLALLHEAAIISIYQGLLLDNSSKGLINKGEILGVASLEDSRGNMLIPFSLYDDEEASWINPEAVMALPEAPEGTEVNPNEGLPVIIKSLLENEDKAKIDIDNSRQLAQGRYNLLVHGRITGIEDSAPYRILVLVNGIEAGSLSTESFSAKDGSLLVQRNGLFETARIYENAPYINVASFFLTRGLANIEIIAQNRAGKETRQQYALRIE